ncbi:MAG: hypothetical protein IPN85_12840 [Flavobacteriales bacterium]|nr:hypothetical protein [Flavobacteriales bacterium]MBK9289886.1 hypothetical protein [Flavobacteriales bacterium]MBL0036628.1 hypothetical protein [Flavobacteriales bacterium]
MKRAFHLLGYALLVMILGLVFSIVAVYLSLTLPSQTFPPGGALLVSVACGIIELGVFPLWLILLLTVVSIWPKRRPFVDAVVAMTAVLVFWIVLPWMPESWPYVAQDEWTLTLRVLIALAHGGAVLVLGSIRAVEPLGEEEKPASH